MSMSRAYSSAANDYIEQAVGDLCCVDGQVCECFPLMSVQEVVDKLSIDKLLFQNVLPSAGQRY